MAPKKKGALKGAALLNKLVKDVPNTSTPDYKLAYAGRFGTADLLPRELCTPQTVAEIATERHLKRGGGSAQDGRKSAKTLQRRQLELVEVLAQEVAALARYFQAYEAAEKVYSDRARLLVPMAARLCNDTMYLSDKFQAVRAYCWHRSQGGSAEWASDNVAWQLMVSGRTVRRWAHDFLTVVPESEQAPAKELHTFSPYRIGGHVEWYLENEVLRNKARKWIGTNSEKKGAANLGVEGFRRYLSGVWDKDTKTWTEKGLLSDILELNQKTELSLEAARCYLHRCVGPRLTAASDPYPAPRPPPPPPFPFLPDSPSAVLLTASLLTRPCLLLVCQARLHVRRRQEECLRRRFRPRGRGEVPHRPLSAPPARDRAPQLPVGATRVARGALPPSERRRLRQPASHLRCAPRARCVATGRTRSPTRLGWPPASPRCTSTASSGSR